MAFNKAKFSAIQKKQFCLLGTDNTARYRELVKTDPTVPATKGDMAILKKDLAAVGQDLRVEMHNVADDTKKTMRQEMAEMYNLIAQRFDDLRLHFDFTVETIRHDLQSANREEILSIKDRLTKVERKVGIV